MLIAVRFLLAALFASLALAGPAKADNPPVAVTVGPGQVITDQATQTEPGSSDNSAVPVANDGTPAPEPPPDASGRRGEIHVLSSVAASSPPAEAAPRQASAASSPATATAAATKTLPFTGVNAGLLALCGLALLAAGSGLLAVLRKPVQ